MQHKNINQLVKGNSDFRNTLFTNQHSQVVMMSIEPGEEIGEEVHQVDQILVFVSGTGKAIVGGEEHEIEPGDLVDVPAGTKHNFINTGNEDWKLYTVYAPAEHKAGTMHHTKEDATNDPNEHD